MNCPRCHRFIVLQDMISVYGQRGVVQNATSGQTPIYDKFYARLEIYQNGNRVLDAFNARVIIFDHRENQPNDAHLDVRYA